MSRETLLAISARRFARGGFEATSMRDIAGEAGMLAGMAEVLSIQALRCCLFRPY